MGKKHDNAPMPRLGQRAPAYLDRGDPNYDSQEEADVEARQAAAAEQTIDEVTETKRAMEGIAEEFLLSRDVASLVAAVDELPSTRTLDDFVARLLRLSLDRTERDTQTALAGLWQLKQVGIVGDDQIARGFDKIAISMEDIKLDAPLAQGIFVKLVESAIAEKQLLPRGFFFRLPETLLKQATSEDGAVTQTLLEELRNFKRRARGVIAEVFAGQGAVQAADVKDELMGRGDLPHGKDMKHEFVKIAILAAMDHTDNEREMVSTLFVGLGNFLSEGDFIRAFTRLLAQTDELKLDVPDVLDFLARFTFRAISDDLLPVGFLDTAERLHIGRDSGRLVVAQVRDMMAVHAISDQHRLSTSLHVRAGTVWSDAKETQNKTTVFKKELQLAISEFFDSHDAGEFVRLLSEWEMDACRAGEIVRKLLVSAMEKTGAECQLVVKLLIKAVKEEKLLSMDDLISGFTQIEHRIDDIKLDIPDVQSMLTSFAHRLKLPASQ